VKPLVVLVTSHHPHTGRGGEVMFVGPELERLAREPAFDLCIAPLATAGAAVPVPAGVTVDRSLARRVARGRIADFAGAWAWPGFGAEWRRAVRSGGLVGIARVWRWAAQARAVEAWARARLPRDVPVLFYTYWRGGATLALARLARDRPRTAVVTRVHGYELYEDRFSPPFQPWVSMYREVDRVVAISAHGRDHLLACGVDADRVVLHRLGIDDVADASGPDAHSLDRPGSAVTARQRDGTHRILSCSFVLPLKRVPRIAAAVVALAKRHPDARFEWTHFGDGPDMGQVRAQARGAPANLAVVLAGPQPNEAVRRHLRDQPVDAFVLASTHEGLPVSIQEALSASLPVIATAVGGVPEAVGSDNGVLLGPDATVQEIVQALERVLFAAEADDAARRRASRTRWARDFDAERNHTAFADALRAWAQALQHP